MRLNFNLLKQISNPKNPCKGEDPNKVKTTIICNVSPDKAKPCDGMKQDTTVKTKGEGPALQNNVKNFIAEILAGLQKSSCTKQLIVGSVSGWTTGFLTMKVGRKAAFMIGGGIIIYQLAQHNGLVATNWDQIGDKIRARKANFKQNPALVANVSRFARTNTCFTAGFVGGFLIGMAC